MAIIFLLINCDEKYVTGIKTVLSTLSLVSDIISVAGLYNLLVKLEAPSEEKLRECITWKIKKIDKIRHTLNLLVKV